MMRIERLYRAGLLSVLEISRECGVPESSVRFWAKEKGWKRDLTADVRQKARAKLVENLAKLGVGDKLVRDNQVVTDEEIIEEAARTQVEVVRQHQRSLGAGHDLTMRMLSELEATTTHHGELEDMIKSDIAPRRQGAMLRAVSLSQRATILKDLAFAAKTWIVGERQAFGIADDRGEDKNGKDINQLTSQELREEIAKQQKLLGLADSDLVKRTARIRLDDDDQPEQVH
jgi:uncharacterized protein YjcR